MADNKFSDDNSITVSPDGYLEVKFVGQQTDDSFRRIYSEALPFIEQITASGKALLGLFDLSQQTGFSLSSDKMALELLEKIPYTKIAMFQVPYHEVAQGIIMATGKGDKTKIFDTREQALAWLLAPAQS